ncbi:heavy metal translocating P-type ATPase [Variovorax sp.]|uniref:heavy metal translocating P-type ATPase n=1 Tax=Variovorax sp. TaxID=1871043 RepID=UPI002D6B7A38|nr:heavy metal translocating P-type ATPase [Variovorax sp.]HYP85008.1 heavy metal translocating P-type ATPase [Variovorax sp.]
MSDSQPIQFHRGGRPAMPPAHDHDHDHDHGHGHAHDRSHDHGEAVAQPGTGDCCASASCCAPAAPAPATPDCCGSSPTPAGASALQAAGGLLLRIPAMDCPVEEGQIRRVLEPVGEVQGLRFDLPGRTLAVDAPPAAWDAVVGAIRSAGFKTETLSAPPDAADTARAQRAELWRLVAALAVAVLAEGFHFFAPDTLAWRVAGMGVAAAAIGLSGVAVFRKGLSSLLRGQLNINALMSVAVAGAFLIGQWPEAAMVMALYSLAELIEARSVERARNAIAGLLALSPPQAEVRGSDGRWSLLDAKAVPVGATVRVKPGERFALDGRVSAGHGAVDQSPVTGESIPVDKAPGDEVFAGTINQSGALEFEVTRPAGDTVLAGIIHAVERAQSQRAPTQRIVDRFAAVYTPAVFVLALAVAIGMPLLAGWAWLDAIYKALVLLVIACPCALVISTPVTVVSGLAAAARRGILVKGGVYLEQARGLKVIALDKTGTLTEGKPRLVDQRVLGDDPSAQARVLRIARSLAARSDHPVSLAVSRGLAQAGEAPLEVEKFGAQAGRGVHGLVDGREYVLGNHRWIHERGQCSPELEAQMRTHEAQGRTLSVLADADGALALFAVADTVKDSSREAVAQLRALGVRPIMLTGDNPTTAQAIAAQVGIDEVRAGLLPQDKLDVVNELGARAPVGMVGDGVNDSPSLAAAAVGFSMGGAGTDTAKEAADVLVMNDDLRRVPETIRLSKKTYAVLWQNITLALGIKAVFFVLAVFGSATMWMAVFADMGASLLVVFNGLRLLRGVRPAAARAPAA